MRLNRQEMPKDLKHKTLRLKWGDVRLRTRSDLWRDNRDVCMLTNIHDPPSKGNFWDEYRNAVKPAIVVDNNRHMGYVNKANRMANSSTASCRTWKGTRKNSFSTCLTWQFSTVTSCCLHVVGRKSHTEIFNSPLSGRCWQDLGMNPDHPGL